MLMEKITAPKRGEDSGAQCLHRAFAALRLLAGGPREGMKLVEVAGELGLSHPTAHRILKALEGEGVVERVPGTRRYTVGGEAAWLGVAAFSRFPITRVAAPILDRLSGIVGDTVLLEVPSHNDTVYCDRRLGRTLGQTIEIAVGTRRPLGASVAGRAMLGFMPEKKLRAMLAENAGRLAELGCAPELVLAGARAARTAGFLCAESFEAPESRALAVPVRDVVGQPVAALSVIARRDRLGAARVAQLLPVLRAATQDIAQALNPKASAAAA